MSGQTLVIEGWLPEQLANSHLSHWVRRRALAAAKERTAIHLRAAGFSPIAGKARLAITLVFPTVRLRDSDNLMARCKGVIDSFVALGLIEDDDTEHLEVAVTARVEPRRAAVEIVLAEAVAA